MLAPQRVRVPKVLVVVALCGALLLSGCSSSGEGEGGEEDQSITFWTLFNTPDRMARQEEIARQFTEQTGIDVEVVGLVVNDMNQAMVSGAASGDIPDVTMTVPDQAANWSREGLLDVEAANEVIDSLGRDTFYERALELVTVGGETVSVPSDGWGQMLFYRADLFEQAGLEPPETLDDVVAAARTLNQGGTAGIVLGTKPGEAYTSQTLEWVSLANGCQLTQEGSATEPALTEPACVNALRYYQQLGEASVQGAQDVDSTRAAYLAGTAAMVSWSPHLLDELAGLDANYPLTCEQCGADPLFLAKNTGIVTVLPGADAGGAQAGQYGQTLNWSILRNANTEAAKQFVEFLLTDGYVDTIGVGAEGRFPMRPGPEPGSTEYIDAWAELPIGADPDNTESVTDLYGPEFVTAIEEGATQFIRWGFGHGSEELAGAVTTQQVLTRDLEGLFRGDDPAAIAEQMNNSVTEIGQELG